MANVLFKRGAEASLLGLGTYIDGCFYLTEDTHRLFVGQGAALVPVNEGVVTVANVAALPATGITGSFYYATAENILCVYNGKTWVQVNANTDTYYKVTAVELEKTTDTVNKKISIVSKVTMKKYDNSTGVETEVASSEFTISSTAIEITQADFTALITGASVGLTQSLIDKTFTLKNEGTGADATKIAELIAGNNVTFTATTNGITISSTDTNTTYTITTSANGTDKAKVTFTEVNGGGAEQTINFAADNKLTVSVTEGEIVYGHDEITVSRPAATAGTLTEDRKFTVVTGVTDDGYGHMAEVTTQTFTLPEDKDVYVTSATYSEDTGKDVGVLTLTRLGETDITVDLGWTAEKISKEISDEIGTALKDLTALNYKGTVGTDGTVTELPETAAAGDMYMAASDSATLEPVTYKTGDLIIATGTEVDGVIPAGSLTWTVVPSGNDLHTDTQFALEAATGTNNAQLKLVNETLGEDKTVINLTDDDIIVVEQKSGTEINFSHANKEVTNETGTAITGTHGGTFDVITGVEADAKGHLSKVVKSTVTLPADNDTTSELSAGVSDGVASIILTETSTGGAETEDTVKIIAGNDDIVITSGNTNEIKISHAEHAGTETKSETRTPLSYGAEIDVVTGITLGTNGHVDSYTVTPYSLPAEKVYTIDETVSTASVDGKTTATVTTTLSDGVNPDDTSAHSISSNSLEIAATGNEIAINMVWGSF